jgi:hypothetical protein
MKTYLLAIHQPVGPTPTAEELEPVMQELGAIVQDMSDAGGLVFHGALFPPETATVVRHSGGDTLLTDGPFAEGKEYLGGLWIVRVPDLDVALGYARRITAATTLPVEVRPFHG